MASIGIKLPLGLQLRQTFFEPHRHALLYPCSFPRISGRGLLPSTATYGIFLVLPPAPRTNSFNSLMLSTVKASPKTIALGGVLQFPVPTLLDGGEGISPISRRGISVCAASRRVRSR